MKSWIMEIKIASPEKAAQGWALVERLLDEGKRRRAMDLAHALVRSGWGPHWPRAWFPDPTVARGCLKRIADMVLARSTKHARGCRLGCAEESPCMIAVQLVWRAL